MGILLIDCSSKKIEFGFADSQSIIFKKELEPEYNADTLTYFIKDTFIKNKTAFREIDYVGLSNGPGSFTGLRIGSAIAKGMCFALGCKLVEVPTLDVIASKFIPQYNATSGSAGRKLTAVIFSNTRTEEFYFCNYEIIPDQLNRISEYSTDRLENIIIKDNFLVINEKLNDNINPEFQERFNDVSELSNIEFLYDLVKDKIKKNNFNDYRTSEPFYMKEFVPNI